MSAQYRLSRPALLWQFIAIAVVVVPHLSHLPIWLLLLILATVGWRLMVHMGRWSFPHWSIRTLISLAACGGVFLSYGGIGGVNGMVALLIAGFSLKSLEIHKRRDALLVVYVAYIVATSALLFDQSVWMAAYVLIAVQLTTAALLAIYQTHNVDIGRPFRTSAVMMMQALPLMLVLFIIIPRMGPIWNLKMEVGAARTGLSDTMSPGEITNLTRSSEVAFRVRFEGERPPQNALYWRAMTYPDFDGRSWYRDEARDRQRVPTESLEIQRPVLKYELMLEATGSRYIPTLDMPLATPIGVRLNPDMTLRLNYPLQKREEYSLESALQYRLTAQGEALNYVRELSLPIGNRRTRELARRWYTETGSGEAFIARLMAFYNGRFTYTLKPPKLGRDSIDKFMFETQRGFCGHFSSSMVFMLRSVGIPARVVAGYQGGEWNPYENYLVVRQYDAHAWVEAWLPQKGWVRIDPTAAVAPERIERPSEELFSEEEDFLRDAPLGGLTVGRNSLLADLWMQWDAISYGWQQWVVNYHSHQTDVLKRLLGEITPLRLALALLIPFSFVMCLVALKLFWRRWNLVRDRHDQALERLSQRLHNKSGLGRQPGETVKNYSDRVAEIRPDLALHMQEIAYCYELMRYAGDDTGSAARRMLVLVRQCQAKV
ncbi:transglutaminaseTgpA domain-containing protein [Pontibacterium sp.]|uniref:transglutaminase family protein n=1 Tax=Pontibacterium sp. TaxID=2036026 RepID=UPI003516D932